MRQVLRVSGILDGGTMERAGWDGIIKEEGRQAIDRGQGVTRVGLSAIRNRMV